MKRNKLRAKRTGKYASKAEAARAVELQHLEKAGIIKDLVEQERFEISPPGCQPIVYITDFSYTLPSGKRIANDVKGLITDVFKLKMKLFQCRFPDIPVLLSKARYRKGAINKFDSIVYHRNMKWKWTNCVDEMQL
jgi:hypothetical protein